MPDRPHGNIQKPTEMLQTVQEQRLNNRIYSKTADAGNVVTAIVEQLAQDLAVIPQKADLKNTEQIKRIVIAYVAMCAKAGVIPSKIGLARALGMSRRTVDYFLNIHPEHPTSEVLELVFDGFAEALSTAALSGSVQQVYAIFLSKCLYAFDDTYALTIKTTPLDPLDRQSTVSEIMARWGEKDFSLLPD